MAKKKNGNSVHAEKLNKDMQETQKLPDMGTEPDKAAPSEQKEQENVSKLNREKHFPISDKMRTPLFIVLGIALGALIAAGVFTALLSAQTADKAQQLEAGQVQLEQKVEEHTHTWVPNYKTVHHAAVYENVWHEPVYESETTYHTVCNDCKKTIDGVAADHIADTGHSGYSTNVPITNEVLKQAGYNEPVLVSEGWDETVIDGVTCTSCGETMNAEEAAEAGVSVPDAQS